MNKQIEEIVKDLREAQHAFDVAWTECLQNKGRPPERENVFYATHLYNAGFRKQSENTVELPCKVGQTIFFYTCVCDKEGEEKFDILEGEVISFSLHNEGLWAYCRYKCGLTYWHLVGEDFCKTVFLTKEEAEAKMRGEQKCG